jgi:hypothetical protein
MSDFRSEMQAKLLGKSSGQVQEEQLLLLKENKILVARLTKVLEGATTYTSQIEVNTMAVHNSSMSELNFIQNVRRQSACYL